MDTFRLRSGKWVRIRPIRPDDGPRLQVAYDALSQESKYRRFLAAKPHLTSADTRRGRDPRAPPRPHPRDRGRTRPLAGRGPAPELAGAAPEIVAVVKRMLDGVRDGELAPAPAEPVAAARTGWL